MAEGAPAKSHHHQPQQPVQAQVPDVEPPKPLNDKRHIYTVLSTKFEVPLHYEITAPLGYGAYGFVVAGVDKRNGQRVAIKKTSRIFRDLADCKRAVREILVLQALKHDKVLAPQRVQRVRSVSGPSGPAAMPACGQAAAHDPQRMQRAPCRASSGSGPRLSGFWHHSQCRGHPFRKTVVRMPGPS